MAEFSVTILLLTLGVMINIAFNV